MNDRFRSISELVKAGRVISPKALRFDVLQDCSLRIKQLTDADAHIYSCDNGSMNSSVSLEFLKSECVFLVTHIFDGDNENVT